MRNDLEKELGRSVDRAFFGTNDPDAIRNQFKESHQAWLQEVQTLGGYLRDIRFLRGMEAKECARKAGVSRKKWQAWEADRETPTPHELEKLCRGLGFGEEKRRRLSDLRARAPRQRLLTISRFRPELLAARGVARIESSLEWQKLPSEVQQALLCWGEEKGLTSFEDMMAFFLELKDDEARELWVDEVFGYLD